MNIANETDITRSLMPLYVYRKVYLDTAHVIFWGPWREVNI